MNFYQSIAEYYEQIFPLNTTQIDFVAKCFENDCRYSVLDIGCGTGSLSIELTKLFSKVSAIDLDEAMLEKAIKKNDKGIHFQKLNMLDIEEEFGLHSFDAVVCFGNTLVHLNGSGEVLDFFNQARRVLKKNGRLLFQIINYDRIIDQNIKSLPTIENDNIQFVRNYHYNLPKNKIGFETILTIKISGAQIKNHIPLYPIRKQEVADLLEKAGFQQINFWGNFKYSSLRTESIPLICSASN